MAPPLPTPPRRAAPPPSPEALYDRLHVRDPAIGALWRHQSHVLTAFAQDQLAEPDVAIELPTGAGKTLVGALIGEWRRQVDPGVSAFVCPTQQLARQAHRKAVGYGIDAVLLIGNHTLWPPDDRTRALSGSALIVTTYSSIFNAHPRIEPRWLVLDDAHAAEGYVASPWSLSVPRRFEPDAYRAAISSLAGQLSEDELERFLTDELDPLRRPPVSMFGPDIVTHSRVLDAVGGAIDPESDARWALGTLSGHSGACCVFVAWQEVLIRPLVVPTAMHGAFADATQRVYLSATLGGAGELERAFGRTRISRVAMPAEWERQGTGRRLLVAPGAANGVDADEFIRAAIQRQERALLLVPSTDAELRAQRLLPDGWTGIGMKEAGDDLEKFISADKTALIAASRYDGIDLPGKACSLIVLEGLPAGTHLQERFLSETAHATELLRERIRCRVMQGMGRATRSRADKAVVLISGQQLLDFLADPSNRRALRAELQAELEYAIWLSTEGHDLAGAIAGFLDDEFADLDAYLGDLADNADLSPPPGADALAEAAQWEVLASRAAWRGSYDEAAALSVSATESLSGNAVSASRTVQKAVAAGFAVLAAEQTGDAATALWASELRRDAIASSATQPWRPVIASVAVPERADSDTRAPRVVERLRKAGAAGRAGADRERMLRQLERRSASGYEDGLRQLGVVLGFESVRPSAQEVAAPDGAWRDGEVTAALEAKSEQEEDGEISPKLVRQANTHAAWIHANLDWPTQRHITAIISPRSQVQAEAIPLADPAVALVEPDTVLDLARRAADAEDFIARRIQGLSGEEAVRLVQIAFSERGLTTDAVLAGLAQHRILEFQARQPSVGEP